MIKFDENGNLILPPDVFKNEIIPKVRYVVCPECKHRIRLQTRRTINRCRRCHCEVIG